MSQLDLFGRPDQPARDDARDAATRDRLARVYTEAARLAARVPPGVRFGTSSWTFPGWAGLVYARHRSERELANDGLAEYARHPLLRTVGIDRSYYAPLPEADLRRYADQLPEGFPCCAKAPASVMSPVRRSGPANRHAGVNPHFLSAELLIQEMLGPMARSFASHTGPIILEVSPTPRGSSPEPTAFADALDAMLARLPGRFRYAVELRDRRLLTAAYAQVLARHGAAHVYNYWSAMPMPAEQAETVPVGTARFCVVRLLLKPGKRYEAERDRFRPFDRLVEPDPGCRAEVVELLLSASSVGAEAFVLVNNKAEGSAPLTIAALAELLADRAQPNCSASQARPSSSGGAM